MRIQLSDHFGYGRMLRFVAPSVVMMIFTSIYNVVDGFFVSNFVGKVPFAAINLMMPLFLTFWNKFLYFICFFAVDRKSVV